MTISEKRDRLSANGQITTQYDNEEGILTMDEEWNVNGCYMVVEGITSPDNRMFGKMAHSKRHREAVAVNICRE